MRYVMAWTITDPLIHNRQGIKFVKITVYSFHSPAQVLSRLLTTGLSSSLLAAPPPVRSTPDFRPSLGMISMLERSRMLNSCSNNNSQLSLSKMYLHTVQSQCTHFSKEQAPRSTKEDEFTLHRFSSSLITSWMAL
jgi:hypothetical protein